METLNGNIRLVDLLPVDAHSDAEGHPVDMKGLVAATGSVTIPTNPANGHTVTIGEKVYTFESSLTDVDGNIKIGANAAATQANLANAINNSGGTPGTDYAASNTRHPSVTATAPISNVIALTARAAGKEGNEIALADGMSGSGNVVSGSTLTGGRDGEQFDNALVRVSIGGITGTPDAVEVTIQEADEVDFSDATDVEGGETFEVAANTSYTKEITRTKKYIRAVVEHDGGTNPTTEAYIVALCHNFEVPLPIQD